MIPLDLVSMVSDMWFWGSENAVFAKLHFRQLSEMVLFVIPCTKRKEKNFLRREIHFFWPKWGLGFYTKRYRAKRGVARYKIQGRMKAKKMNFPRKWCFSYRVVHGYDEWSFLSQLPNLEELSKIRKKSGKNPEKSGKIRKKIRIFWKWSAMVWFVEIWRKIKKKFGVKKSHFFPRG